MTSQTESLTWTLLRHRERGELQRKNLEVSQVEFHLQNVNAEHELKGRVSGLQHKILAKLQCKKLPILAECWDRHRASNHAVHTAASPPCDLELVDGPLAIVVVDEVLVAYADALLLGGDAALGQVADDAVQQVVDVRHGLPGPEGHVHLAVVLEQLGLAVGALEAQRVEEWPLVRSDGHLLLVHADLELGEARFLLHGSQFGDFHDALQIF